jgi:hypothetical protein
VIEMRPIYRDADRVRAHVLVAVLAFVLYRALEKKLKAGKLDLSAAEALTALKTVRVVDIDLGNGARKLRNPGFTACRSGLARARHFRTRSADPTVAGRNAHVGTKQKRTSKNQWLSDRFVKQGLGYR